MGAAGEPSFLGNFGGSSVDSKLPAYVLAYVLVFIPPKYLVE